MNRRRRIHRADAATMVGGVAVLAAGMLVIRNGRVRPWERRVFRSINDLPDFLYAVAWPVQQLGAILVAPILAVVLLWLRRRWLAVAVLVVAGAKLAVERVVKAMVTRERPGTSIGAGIHTRGQVSLRGESFVSGHAILVAALAGVLTGWVPRTWRPALWALVALVALARVYVGAHNPLDVVCGAALGLALAGAVSTAIGRRRLSAR